MGKLQPTTSLTYAQVSKVRYVCIHPQLLQLTDLQPTSSLPLNLVLQLVLLHMEHIELSLPHFFLHDSRVFLMLHMGHIEIPFSFSLLPTLVFYLHTPITHETYSMVSPLCSTTYPCDLPLH